jgi:spermidine synthase
MKTISIIAIYIICLNLFCKDIELENPLAKTKSLRIDEKEIYSVKSKYSTIKIRDYGSIRSLYFVRDNGDEALESSIDTAYPHELFLLYTQTMFASFLISESQEELLLIGLGGGSMVHYINHFFPKTNLDIVDIDPEILNISKKYFALNPNPKTKIYIEDAFSFISKTPKKYNIIFMDAFLKPSSETDSTGIAKKFKEKEFYKNLKSKLKENGLVVFNINSNETLSEDIEKIREEFNHIYKFQKNQSGNLIVIASMNKEKISKDAILKKAKLFDEQKKANFSYIDISSYQKD